MYNIDGVCGPCFDCKDKEETQIVDKAALPTDLEDACFHINEYNDVDNDTGEGEDTVEAHTKNQYAPKEHSVRMKLKIDEMKVELKKRNPLINGKKVV